MTGPLPDARLLAERVLLAAQRRRCDTCGLVTNPGGLASHQKVTGHGWTEVGE